LYAALEMERIREVAALVAELDRHGLVEERIAAQRRSDGLPGEQDLGKDERVRPEADVGAVPVTLADRCHGSRGRAPDVLLTVHLAVAVHLDEEALAEGVHH